MQRLNNEEWKNIFRNLKEEDQEVEIQYLDNVGKPGEWCLCFDCELFEDGFQTEEAAQKRLDQIENEVCIIQIDELKSGSCVVIAKSGDNVKRFPGIYDSSLKKVFFTIPSNYEVTGYLQ